MENWILAKDIKGIEVKVRQTEPFGKMFIGEDGTMYDISDLELTQTAADADDFFTRFKESQQWSEQRQTEYQNLMNKMMSSMDVNSIADHKAEIEEREYWRKLRGDIAIEVVKTCNDKINPIDIACITQRLFDELYKQHMKFFMDKIVVSVPVK